MSEERQVEQPRAEESFCKIDGNPENTVKQNVDAGSTFGKFKDATRLLEAYENLQSEFTRKSQKLAEVSRELESFKNVHADDATPKSEEGSMSKSALSENARSENMGESQSSEVSWESKVDDFFSRIPEAKEHAKDIANVLRQEPELMKMKNGIHIAFKIAKSSNVSNPADLIDDPEFVQEHIMKNEKLKSQIIKDYLMGVKAQEKSPSTLSHMNSFVLATSTKKNAGSIEGAGKIFEKMLKGE